MPDFQTELLALLKTTNKHLEGINESLFKIAERLEKMTQPRPA